MNGKQRFNGNAGRDVLTVEWGLQNIWALKLAFSIYWILWVNLHFEGKIRAGARGETVKQMFQGASFLGAAFFASWLVMMGFDRIVDASDGRARGARKFLASGAKFISAGPG